MPQTFNELSEIESESLEDDKKPGLLTIIILFVLLLAMVASLMWPLLSRPVIRHYRPTPTSPFLQEA